MTLFRGKAISLLWRITRWNAYVFDKWFSSHRDSRRRTLQKTFGNKCEEDCDMTPSCDIEGSSKSWYFWCQYFNSMKICYTSCSVINYFLFIALAKYHKNKEMPHYMFSYLFSYSTFIYVINMFFVFVTELHSTNISLFLEL